jgi:hypothetical protein
MKTILADVIKMTPNNGGNLSYGFSHLILDMLKWGNSPNSMSSSDKYWMATFSILVYEFFLILSVRFST